MALALCEWGEKKGFRNKYFLLLSINYLLCLIPNLKCFYLFLCCGNIIGIKHLFTIPIKSCGKFECCVYTCTDCSGLDWAAPCEAFCYKLLWELYFIFVRISMVSIHEMCPARNSVFISVLNIKLSWE